MNTAVTLPPAMDKDTLEQLIDVVRKFVTSGSFHSRLKLRKKTKFPKTWCRKCATWGCLVSRFPKSMAVSA